jgi:broad-specificity NMP kinase
MLYQHYLKKRTVEGAREGADAYPPEVEWKRIMHSCLYLNVAFDLIREPKYYLHTFLPIVKRSPLTVNYNFDDTIQQMLLQQTSSDESRTSRGYSTLWSGRVQIGLSRAVLYHPNGFLPHSLTEQLSDSLVFLEESFADQLIDSATGQYSTLCNHFAQNTCLFIGVSMNDPTLRYMLRQCARIHPGHYHYYVSYVDENDHRDEARRRAEFDANFAVHNLITLFLNASDLAALGDLLCMGPEDYGARVRELGLPIRYRFFLAGPVGVGKTTALSNFRSVRNFEEWLDPLPELMAKEPSTLTVEDLKEIDAWVDAQLERKNNLLFTDRCGMDVIDRAPLDAFAFIKQEAWEDRARAIHTSLERTYSGRRLVPGHMILLQGDPRVLFSRARRVLRSPSKAGLERQDEVLRRIYEPSPGHRGVTIIDTRNRTAAEIAKEIARVIHNRPYEEFDFHERLEEIEKGAFARAGEH